MTHKLITKKRIAITVRFFLRQPKKDAHGNKKPLSNPHPIQCRVTVDGTIDAGFSTGVRVDPAIWDQKGQRANGRSDHAQRVTRQLIQIRTKLEQIHDWQFERYDKKQGPKPTPKTIRHEFDTGKRPVQEGEEPGEGMTLIGAYESVMLKLRNEQGTPLALSPDTLKIYDICFKKLKEFLGNNTGFLAEDVTTGWAKRFYTWLLKQPVRNNTTKTLSLTVAYRTVKRVSYVLDYISEFQALPKGNPLMNLKLQTSPTKEVYFMEPHHIDELFKLSITGSRAVVLWWAKLMVITGLDYPDAIEFAKNRDKYTDYTPYGQKISIPRAKTGVMSVIPVTGDMVARLDVLFTEYPKPPRIYVYIHVNELLADIAEMVGFTGNLTTKILRKTAGAWMLWRGFRLEAVSKALGHSDTITSQRYYVKITGTLIDLEMKRMYDSGESKAA